MTQYVATVNVPGYLPMDDDPPTFDTARQAWEYLLEERERGEEGCSYAHQGRIDGHNGEFACALSEAYHELDKMVTIAANMPDGFDGTGTVHGGTPGYDGDHDLGLAYTVSIAEES